MLQNLINKLNDLRPRQLLMLAGFAALLMFVSIYGVMSFLQDDDADRDNNGDSVEKIQVVVAKTNIPARTRIQENMLQLKEMPVDVAPKDAIRSFKDVLDVQVKVPIFSGDTLTLQKISAEKNDEGFIATIPLDCRAVSISVNDITSVAGFAKPGDFVDLLLVEKTKDAAVTNVLLQNVQLLSINKDMTGTSISEETGLSGTKAINNPSIATFALRPEDVLKLISASKLGEIYMSLRPSKPKNAYIGEMEYTLESAESQQSGLDSEPRSKIEPRSESSSRRTSSSELSNSTPPPEPSAEPSLPAIPNNSAPVMPTPQLPSSPVTPTVPKIEIIQGDEITQRGDAVMSSYLPVIPSGVEAPIASPPIVSEPPVDIFENATEPLR